MDEGTTRYVLGGGCNAISIGWTCVNMIFGVWVGLDRLRYHTRMPKVNPRMLRVAMAGLLTITKGGKGNEIMYIGNEPQ